MCAGVEDTGPSPEMLAKDRTQGSPMRKDGTRLFEAVSTYMGNGETRKGLSPVSSLVSLIPPQIISAARDVRSYYLFGSVSSIQMCHVKVLDTQFLLILL